MQKLALFYPHGHETHAEHGHPERPERVEAIRTALQQIDRWEAFPRLEPLNLPQEILETVHSPDYLAKLKTACAQGQRLDADTYTTPASWNLSLNAAGGAAAVAEAVWLRQASAGFALTRPPGHHATHYRGMGFCLLNNIALAAEYLFQRHFAKRLAIFDLDLHHGNGTQDIFWKRGDLLYISMHQYPHYPGTGRIDEVGAVPGEGATANFPMPSMSGDAAYRAVMDALVLPLLTRFAPEMILVSYGFDAHWRDPLGRILLSAETYNHLIASLTAWAGQNCQGRIALFLEGGYNLEAAAACSQGVVAALLGEEWQDPLGPSPYPETDAWKETLNSAKKIWKV